MQQTYTEQEVREIIRINKKYSLIVEDYALMRKSKSDSKKDLRIQEAMIQFKKFPKIFIGEMSYLEKMLE